MGLRMINEVNSDGREADDCSGIPWDCNVKDAKVLRSTMVLMKTMPRAERQLVLV